MDGTLMRRQEYALKALSDANWRSLEELSVTGTLTLQEQNLFQDEIIRMLDTLLNVLQYDSKNSTLPAETTSPG